MPGEEIGDMLGAGTWITPNEPSTGRGGYTVSPVSSIADGGGSEPPLLRHEIGQALFTHDISLGVLLCPRTHLISPDGL